MTMGMVLVVCLLPALAVAQPWGAGRGYGHGPVGPGRMHRGGPEGGRGYGPMGPGRMYRGGPDAGGEPHVGIVLRFKEQLDLSDEQLLKLKAIKEEVKEQFKTSADAVWAKREALREAVESDATEAAIRAAAVELGGALGDQAVLTAGTKTNVDEVLTDGQKAKLQELRDHRWQRRNLWLDGGRGRMGRRPRGRRGPVGTRGPESAFLWMDADGNGAISPEEFETDMQRMRGRREGRGPQGWGRPRP